jgi:Zn-dependent protease/predicted transcriptional regulator
MTSSVKLGRIAGVEIGVNWSWPIAFALIVWLLAAGVFPARSPGLDEGTYMAMAATAAVAFFACLVLHELGHALQARRDDVQIDGITLWLFGGVARFSGPFPSPGAELRIALAGPAVSLALALGLILAATLLPLPVALDAMLAWLGFINLVLLAFNLLPALPLDGGRVVRALVWRIGGDFVGATRIAAALGSVLGGLLVALGIALLPAGEALAGIWVVLIGWFVLLAGEGERRQVSARSALDGVRVRDVMVEDPPVVRPDTPLRELAYNVLREPEHVSFPVVDGDRPVGLMSLHARSALVRSGGGRVADHMIAVDRAPTLSPDQPASDAVVALAQSEVSSALVCEGERLLGLVSISDLGRVLELRTAEGKAARAALDADEVRPAASRE